MSVELGFEDRAGALVASVPASAVGFGVGILVYSASTVPPTAPPCPAGAWANATRHRATSPIVVVRKASLRAWRRPDIAKSFPAARPVTHGITSAARRSGCQAV